MLDGAHKPKFGIGERSHPADGVHESFLGLFFAECVRLVLFRKALLGHAPMLLQPR